MRNLRWPIFIFIPLLVAALVFWEQGDSQGGTSGATAANPTSWFCPVLNQAEPLNLVNPTDSSVKARVTIYSSLFEQDGVTESTPYLSQAFEIEVPANGSELAFANELLQNVVASKRSHDVSRVANLKQSLAVFISALVEFPVAGPVADTSLCTTQTAAEWMIPFASTNRDACYFLAIFNPFSNVAVVDIEFATDDGLRDPFQGVVVPPESLVVLDVGERIVRRDHFSTRLIARTGKVAVSKHQTFTGKPREIERKCPEVPYDFSLVSGEDFSRLWGSEIVVGASTTSLTWYFPAGINPVTGGSYTIYNPDTRFSVNVKMTLITDLGSPVIKVFSVPPSQRVAVRTNQGELHPLPTFPAIEERPTSQTDGLRHWAIFEAETGVVVEKLQTFTGTPFGIQGGLGIPMASTEIPLYKYSLSFGVDFDIAHLGIANPSSDTIVIIRVPGVIQGVEISPRKRFLLGVPNEGLPDALIITSNSPIVMAPYS